MRSDNSNVYRAFWDDVMYVQLNVVVVFGIGTAFHL